MAIEAFSIKDRKGRQFLTYIEPYTWDNSGHYLRIRQDVLISNFSGSALLGLVNITKDNFLRMFNEGQADARGYLFTEPDTYNPHIRKKYFSFGKSVPPSAYLERPKIRLCGADPDLWTVDNPQSLQESVKVFQQVFPEFAVVSTKTALDYPEG